MRPLRTLAVLSLAAALGAAPLFAQEPLAAGSDGVPVPKKTKHVQPVYPAEALAQGIRGIVILEVVVGTTGKVESTSLIRSVPGLDEAAIAAARQWEYEPVKVDGKPVAVRLTVPITFALALPKIARDTGVPELRQGATPAWPAGAPDGGGAAVAEVTLDPDGRVGVARITDGAEPWAGALLTALKTWRFPPPDEDAVVSFRVSAEFVGGRPDQRRVDLKAGGLHKADLLAAAQPGGGASPASQPPAAQAPAAQAPAAPTPASPAPASSAPAPPATTGSTSPAAPRPAANPEPAAAPPTPQAPADAPAAPKGTPASAASGTTPPSGSAPTGRAPTPAGGAVGGAGSGATPAPVPQAPNPAPPAPKAPPASQPSPATPPPGAPASPGSTPDTAPPPRTAPPAATPPPGRGPAGGTAGAPAAGSRPAAPPPGAPAAASAPPVDRSAPPVEVITAPPPAAPPENGVSAVRDVTLQPGVPDLARGRRPVSPPVARMSGTTGTVEVAFSVSAAGTTSVQSVVGPEPLRHAAQEAVASWVFRRARADRAYLTAVFNYAEDKTTAEIRPQPTPASGSAPAPPPDASTAPAAPSPGTPGATTAPAPQATPPGSAAPAPGAAGPAAPPGAAAPPSAAQPASPPEARAPKP